MCAQCTSFLFIVAVINPNGSGRMQRTFNHGSWWDASILGVVFFPPNFTFVPLYFLVPHPLSPLLFSFHHLNFPWPGDLRSQRPDYRLGRVLADHQGTRPKLRLPHLRQVNYLLVNIISVL
jgi:hypothetical protein